jgi:hypothetical protein
MFHNEPPIAHLGPIHASERSSGGLRYKKMKLPAAAYSAEAAASAAKAGGYGVIGEGEYIATNI